MLVSLPHFTWQVLRAVLRSEAAGTTALGRDLRLAPTRKTKDGTFLDQLVREGFLVVAGKADPAGGGPEVPLPFRQRYKLTTLGKHAAEYGEYDMPYSPPGAVEVREVRAAEGGKPARPSKTRAKGK